MNLSLIATRVSRTIAIATVMLSAATAFAQPVVIDGVFSPGEWASATSYRFSVTLLLSGVISPAELYVTNDGSNLYACVRYKQPEPIDSESIYLSFDVNGDNELGTKDDGVIVDMFHSYHGASSEFQDVFYFTRAGCFLGGIGICSNADVIAGGTSDGGGIADNVGNWTTFEVWHPLYSGDIYDLYAGIPREIRLSLLVKLRARGRTWGMEFDTFYPGPGMSTFASYVTH